jgi:hypothetical protein
MGSVCIAQSLTVLSDSIAGFGWTNGVALDLAIKFDFADLEEVVPDTLPLVSESEGPQPGATTGSIPPPGTAAAEGGV